MQLNTKYKQRRCQHLGIGEVLVSGAHRKPGVITECRAGQYLGIQVQFFSHAPQNNELLVVFLTEDSDVRRNNIQVPGLSIDNSIWRIVDTIIIV